jgi:Lar family restriction alleviation protein
MTSQEELKPCPFCGGEASASGTIRYSANHVHEQGWDQDTFYFCNCPDCGVNNRGIVGHRTPAEAIAAWNRRSEGAGE